MMTRRKPLRRAPGSLLVALLVGGLAAGAAYADYKEAYKKALDAIAQKHWTEASSQLRLAIAERPDAAGVLGAGTLFRRYTPHYWLGVALAEQGQCKLALDVFDVATKQGKLSKEEERDVSVRRQACQTRVSQATEAVAQAQREVDAAAAAAFQVAGVEGSPVMRSVWREGSPSFAARQQPATAQLASARSLLGRAQADLDPDKATEAARLAQQARRDLEAIYNDAAGRRDALAAQAQRGLAELHKTADEARKSVSFVTRSLAPLPEAIAQRCEKLEELLTGAAAVDLGTPGPELQRIQDALRVALRDLRAAVKPPPDDLQRAATAYLSGDYAATLSVLSTAQFAEPRALAHACLLKAAALYGLHSIQPAIGEQNLDQAREELRRCVGLQAPVRPVADAFPPSFVALYDEVAAERPPG